MTNKKYTDEEIKKALECFVIDKDTDEFYCVGCAFETKGLCIENCSEGLARACLALINRQQAEIKKRNADIEGLLFAIQSLSGHLSSAKAEAIKEFENLIVNNLIEQTYGRDYLLCLIKEWAKEMTEVQK